MGANDNINKYSGYLSDAQRRRIKKQFEDLRRSGADEARTLEVKSTQDYTAGRNQLANLGLSANPLRVQSGEVNRLGQRLNTDVAKGLNAQAQRHDAMNEALAVQLANETIAARNRAASAPNYDPYHQAGVKPYVENDRYTEEQW